MISDANSDFKKQIISLKNIESNWTVKNCK